MIPGIVAQDGGIASTTPGGGGTPLGVADFVAGTYNWGATTLTASQVTNQTGWISGSGLAIPSAAGAAAHVLNQFATALLTCNWTVVIEADILVSSNLSPPSNLLSVYNAPTDAFEMGLDISSQQNWFITDHDNNASVTRYTDDSTDNDSGGTADTTGIHRYAVTRTNTKLAASVDGYSVTTDTTALTLPNLTYPMDRVYLGGYYNGTGRALNIRSLAVYSPQSDGQLPILSA
jgi:hypothetical protein